MRLPYKSSMIRTAHRSELPIQLATSTSSYLIPDYLLCLHSSTDHIPIDSSTQFMSDKSKQFSVLNIKYKMICSHLQNKFDDFTAQVLKIDIAMYWSLSE